MPAEPLPSVDTAKGFARHRDWERDMEELGRRLSPVPMLGFGSPGEHIARIAAAVIDG